MNELLQILAILIVAILLAPTLGHALELPGKMRLDERAYFTTRTIYWPGFTVIGGAAEVLSLVVTLALVITTSADSLQFWLFLAAFGLLAALHAVYWIVVHPINKVWVKDIDLTTGGRRFFDTGSGPDAAVGWKTLRDRWEYAHAARALLALVALTLLATAAALER